MALFKVYEDLIVRIKDIYDEKDETLVFTVTGTSIKKLEDFSKDAHSLQDSIDLVIKFTKKGHSIEEIGTQEE